MELTDVPGVGAAKAERLQAAGIRTVKDLAEIDLRRKWDVGIGPEVLKRSKHAARRLCDQEGIPYAKASYGTKDGAAPVSKKQPAASGAAEAPPAEAPAADATRPTNGAGKRPGLLARIFRRA